MLAAITHKSKELWVSAANRYRNRGNGYDSHVRKSGQWGTRATVVK